MQETESGERTSGFSGSSFSASDVDAAAAGSEDAGAAERAWREPFHLWLGVQGCQTVLGEDE